MFKINLKKQTVLIVFLIIFMGILLPGSNNMKIPLRIVGDRDHQKIKILNLYINKRKVEIKGMSEKKRSVEGETLLGRNFILSFMSFDKYDKALENCVSYFVTEILRKSDSLIIHTNINIYQIKVSANKERMILEIGKRLKKDLNFISKRASRAIKSINSEVNKIERFFGSAEPNSIYLVDGVRYFKFFTSIIPDVQFYRNEFIIPEKKGFREINNLLGYREGDRYWFYFQNGDIFPFSVKIRNVIKKIKRNLSLDKTGDGSWKKFVEARTRDLSDAMMYRTQYPTNFMKSEFINTNTTFLGLIYTKEKTRYSNKEIDIQLPEILKKVSMETGGVLLKVDNLEKGLQKIRKHEDHFWEIEFNIPQDKGEKDIRIELEGRKERLAYRRKFEAVEFDEFVKHLFESGIIVDGIELIEEKLSFSIKGFALNKRGGFGLLKVIIQFYNNRGEEVFSRSNTLRAGKREINISIRIPPILSKKHNVKISVLDIISNRLVNSELKQNI